MLEQQKSVAEEKQEVLDALNRSRERFLAVVDNVEADFHDKRTDEKSWSVLQCVEHVVNAEEGMLRLWQKLSQPGSEDRAKDVLAKKTGTDRSNKREAPERVVPQGRIKSVTEARERFLAARAATIATVEQMPAEELRSKTVPHQLLNSADGYQLFHVMAGHCERHAEQIEETVKRLAASRGAA
ncbi:MAG TPA: DinB family protein [candidate division Zixibacteria bacterium]|nr:DinB family protein [candidate division Zixibacteria bacterium]